MHADKRRYPVNKSAFIRVHPRFIIFFNLIRRELRLESQLHQRQQISSPRAGWQADNRGVSGGHLRRTNMTREHAAAGADMTREAPARRFTRHTRICGARQGSRFFFFRITNPMTERQIEADETPCPPTVGEWNANSLK
jgi:hypothetical protein